LRPFARFAGEFSLFYRKRALEAKESVTGVHGNQFSYEGKTGERFRPWPQVPLSGGNEADAPSRRLLLETLEPRQSSVDMAMNRAYSDDLTRINGFGLDYF